MEAFNKKQEVGSCDYTCSVSTQKIRLQEPHKTKGPRGVQLQSKQQIRRREKEKEKRREVNRRS